MVVVVCLGESCQKRLEREEEPPPPPPPPPPQQQQQQRLKSEELRRRIDVGRWWMNLAPLSLPPLFKSHPRTSTESTKMSGGGHFRSEFGKLSRSINWFPKHMNSGLKQMQAKLRSVDCILEVHDARIPFSGRNPTFSHSLVGDKPHILVLNKSDLIRPSQQRVIRSLLEPQTPNVIFTNSKFDQDPGIKKLVPKMRELMEGSERYHRSGSSEFHAMIIGVPNVGKSSLINLLRSRNLRKGRALKVGPSAGVTKCVHEKMRIAENPPLFLFDTPGILTPRISDTDTAMKLALCGNLPDHNVGQTLIADYILFFLNSRQDFRYVTLFGLDGPCDCITTVLTRGALHLNIMSSLKAIDASNVYYKKPDFQGIANLFIDKFRRGDLGRYILDSLEDPESTYRTSTFDFDLSANETFVSNESK